MSLEEIKNVRLQKLQKITEKGDNPYPAGTSKTHTIKKVVEDFDILSSANEKVSLVGRILSTRGQGGLLFCDFDDGTGKFQAVIKKDDLGEETFSYFESTIDNGDFVEFAGTLFATKRGEKSVQVSSFKILGKSLLPLPEKWHGLQDTEERFRKRYLDILSNPEIKNMLIRKGKFWNSVRTFLLSRDFIEVDTPTLEVTTGGAEANPFKTHHRDFDLDLFLRISVGELWQKRLIAGGLPRTFEIGRVYRNEGSSPEHTQEFTNVELYVSYMDYKEGKELMEELMRFVINETYGKTKFASRGFELDIEGEWKSIDYVDTVKEMTGIDVLTATEEEMRDKLNTLKVKFVGENRERLTDTLWKFCRRQIAGPVWLENHPKLVSPLAKAKPENPLLTERVQLIFAGAEVGNGWSELNDPVDQRERFEAQQKLIESGDEEAMMPEWEFVEMLEHGMPPTFGYGFGERLFAFLEDKPIREVQTFPLVKPENKVGN